MQSIIYNDDAENKAEQDNDEEFDYLDSEINKTVKLNQFGDRSVFIKKYNKTNNEDAQKQKEQMLKETLRLKQLNIQERKKERMKTQEEIKNYEKKYIGVGAVATVLTTVIEPIIEIKANVVDDWEDLY